jgi:hypothetical protein
MDLGRVMDKVKLTLVDVESDEGERASVKVSVYALVDALHEAHVGVPEEGIAAVVRPGALDMSDADEAVEIIDRARVAADLVGRRRVDGPRLMEVDIRTAKRVRNEDAPGDGQGRDDTWQAAVLQTFQE